MESITNESLGAFVVGYVVSITVPAELRCLLSTASPVGLPSSYLFHLVGDWLLTLDLSAYRVIRIAICLVLDNGPQMCRPMRYWIGSGGNKAPAPDIAMKRAQCLPKQQNSPG